MLDIILGEGNRVTGDAIFLIGPFAQIDQAAAFTAKWKMRGIFLYGFLASRTFEGALDGHDLGDRHQHHGIGNIIQYLAGRLPRIPLLEAKADGQAVA